MILKNKYIIARAEDIACYYDDLIRTHPVLQSVGEKVRTITRRQACYRIFARVEEKTLLSAHVRQRIGSHPALRFIRLFVRLCRARIDGRQRQNHR